MPSQAVTWELPTRNRRLRASGVHPKGASERLGHSKVGITLDLYSHVMPGMQEDAAAQEDNALQIAMQELGPKPIRQQSPDRAGLKRG
jgi:hypothetical protein